MSDVTASAVEKLDIQPNFDMELLMSLLQEKRLGGQVLEELVGAFERWSKEFTALMITAGKHKYLVFWLSEAVENEVDTVWEKSAESAFRLNCVGQALIMNAVYQALPEVEDAGCAPAPKPTEELRQALKDAGIPYLEGDTGLCRRFSVLTNYPFRGACDICALRESCPKANGHQGDSYETMVLPGFQQEAVEKQ